MKSLLTITVLAIGLLTLADFDLYKRDRAKRAAIETMLDNQRSLFSIQQAIMRDQLVDHEAIHALQHDSTLDVPGAAAQEGAK